MAEVVTVAERAREWGNILATLPPEQRKEAERLAYHTKIVNLPKDEVTKSNVSTLGEFVDTQIEIPPMLVEPGIVARGGITAMIAKGGKGKTTLSLNRLMRWACEQPLFDELPDVMKPAHPIRSLIVENEGSGWHTQRMLKKILNAPKWSDEQREQVRNNVHIWGDGGWSDMKLDNPDNVKQLSEAVAEVKADILFLEPFRRLWHGEENSSTEMNRAMDAFHTIANEQNCAILVTHHMRKGSSEGVDLMDMARGSSVLTDLAAVMETWTPVAGADQRQWELAKHRWGDPPAPMRMTWEAEKWGYTFVGEPVNVRRVIETVMGLGEVPVSEIAHEMGENVTTTRRWLKKAVDAGELDARKKMNPVSGGTALYYRVPPRDEDEAADDNQVGGIDV
jgi:hypothetical protein